MASIHPKSPASEAYRMVRTNLQFSGLGEGIRSILITSPGPEEGKSTTLANLAVTMAQAGHRVVVADADLRKPTLHKIFGLSNTRGLVNLLLALPPSGEGLPVKPAGVENLWALTSGPLPPNPSELLGGGRFARVVERLREEGFDLVLVDSPPVLAVADTSIMAPVVDGVILVLRAAETRNDLARESLETLKNARAHILGAVLNGVRREASEYHYYYYYGRGQESAAASHAEDAAAGSRGQEFAAASRGLDSAASPADPAAGVDAFTTAKDL